jgi:hypothetical protein
MRYQAKPVQVEAFEIAEVVHVVQTGKRRTFLVLQGCDGRTPFTKDILTPFSPRRGDFLVIQESGERHILSRPVFEARFQEVNVLTNHRG